jgi:hypothetical protein
VYAVNLGHDDQHESVNDVGRMTGYKLGQGCGEPVMCVQVLSLQHSTGVAITAQSSPASVTARHIHLVFCLQGGANGSRSMLASAVVASTAST